MNFALDYDGTYTADPQLWLAWLVAAQERGHKVYVVTMRFESECFGPHAKIDLALIAAAERVICTGRQAKAPHMEKLGIPITVWIDDNPQAVHMTAQQIWGDVVPEGQPHDPANDPPLDLPAVCN